MPSSVTITESTRTVRHAVKVNHLRAVRRFAFTSRSIQRRADDVKREIRRIAEANDPFAARGVQRLFADVAKEFEATIARAVQDQSTATARRVFAALKASYGTRYVPFAAIRQAGKSEPYEPAGFTNYLGIIGAFSAMAFVGVMAYRSGNKDGLVASELAVDRLALRARRAVQFHGVGASNAAIFATVEDLFGVPVAKRVPVARMIPFAKLIPVAARKYPPFIINPPEPPETGQTGLTPATGVVVSKSTTPNPQSFTAVPDPTEFYPEYRELRNRADMGMAIKPKELARLGELEKKLQDFAKVTQPAAPPVIPPTVRPSRTQPAPGEPEFVILPDPTGRKHRGYPNEEYVLPGDPAKPAEPRKPIRTLVGWQIISMLDNRVRPKHAERHGRVFYYNPRPERGERGMDECPHPPYESDKDGGVWAANCRCVLNPVFEDQEQ